LVDPELMIRMLLVDYCMGIRSERRLCEKVRLNLAYRWFCRLDLTDAVPDHSTFSKNRHGRFRDSDLFRHLFNTVLTRCFTEGLVGGKDFGVDVDATAPIRQAEVGITMDMILRTRERFGLYPAKLVADTAYGSAPMLGWLVEEEGIEPYIPVMDKSHRQDGTFSRDDFAYDHDSDSYTCPGGKQLVQFRRTYKKPRSGVDAEGLMRYRASKKDCDVCPLKQRCCPKEPARKVLRSIHEGARQMARDITKTDAYVTASYARKKVEMLFAHLKRILRLDRLRLRGPNGAKDEFILAATVQNLRKLAKLVPSPA
jgi:hypothetical protein